MTIEELVSKLGIADDKKEGAGKAVKEFLDGAYVPKSRFNEVNEEKNDLKKQLSDRDGQLETLKKSKGDAEALKAQIKALQDKNKADSEAAAAKMKDLQLSTAIQLAIGNDAQDAGIVAGLLDKSKLILGEDGKVTGLAEQVEALKKDKAFLFKPAEGGSRYNPKGGNPPGDGNPFSKEHWNVTRQGQIYKESPDKARELAQAAGMEVSF